jgi:parallel beta helix pectate lyase-like protein
VPLTIAIEGKLRAGQIALMLLVLTLPLSVLTPGEVAAAGTYYVSTSGSDATGTGSLAKPWRTIQKSADSAGPGSTVLIQPGTYTGAVEIAITGTGASPVIFRGNGAGVVIEASSVARDAVLITESSYVTWENIRIQNAPRAGLRVSSSNHVTIRDNVFANNQRWGLFTDFSDDLLIEGNESFGATIEHGIYHSNSGDRPVIRGNVIHDNYANGLHMNGDISMGGDGTITSPVVEGNYIYNNGVGGGSGINMDGVERAMIRNNVIVDAHASGISMYQIDGGICSRNNTVYHNTIVVAADGRWAINIPNNGCTGNQLLANILYSNHSYRGAINIVDGARSGFASNYNVLEGVFSTNGGDSILTFTQWKALGYDANSKVSTPSALFVNPSSDFHLTSGSPAINIGTTLASVKTDFDGRARPQGSSSDAGAFEAASPADCRLSPTSGPVYTRITVTCTGFASGELVMVRWDGAQVASFTAGSTGSGKVTFSAPRSVAGRHLVKAVGDKGTSVPSRGFVIAPSISLSPTGGVISQQISATMRGFAAGEVITLRFRTAPGSSRTVAKNIVASSSGTASVTFVVPSGSVGTYSIEAAGSLGGFASAPFTRIFGTAELPTATPTATATPSPTATSTIAPPEPTATEEPAASATPTPVEELPKPGGTPIG